MKKTKTRRLLKVLLWTFVSCFMLNAAVLAQARRITGQIISKADNQPLQGATVVVKGTNKSTSTNQEGKFAIDAATNDVLVISFVGYNSQEIKVGTSNTLNLGLSEQYSNQNEVIVVGYGRMRKTDQTSAQTSISAADIGRTVNTTIEQAIQGRAANVYVTQNTGQPGGGISVNIRGISSLNGTNEPLYVIDGVQIQPSTVSYGATASTNALANLNPADIESMEVLQGPSATAIYGSRGTNGVILITTKRGKAGGIKVGYNFLYSLQDKPDILPTMNLREFAQMTNEIRALTGGTPPTEFQDPSVLGEGTNWQKALFKTAALKKHQLTLSGGNDNTTYYLSGEMFDQEGVAIGSDFKRYSFRLNVDNQARKWLKLSTNLNFSKTDEELGSTSENVINTAINMSPAVAVKNPNGTWGGADATNGSSVQFTPLNPVAIANLIENTYKRYNFLGGLNADVTLMKGLVFRTSVNGSYGTNDGRFYVPTYQLGDKVNGTASLSLNNSSSFYWNWNQLLQYNTRLGKHDIGVMIGHESQENTWKGMSGSRTGFLSNEVVELPLGGELGQQNGSYKGSSAMESYLGRVNYSYDDRYLLQGVFRADASSNFGTNNRWAYFPSVSVAWRLSQEKFMQDVAFINDFKIRLEYGKTGNQGPGNRQFTELASVSSPLGVGFRASRYGNPDLRWEATETKNIGFNLSLFQNRVQLEGDYYIKKTDNLLMENPLPDYMGTSGEGNIGRPFVNIGALQNKGFGLTLNTVNIDKGGFSWKSNINVSQFDTEITKFYSEAAFLDRAPWYISNVRERSVVGQTPWLFYGYISDGIFQTVKEIEGSAVPTVNGVKIPVQANGGVWVGDRKYRDIGGPDGKPDGVIDERDQTFIGNPWPKTTLGFTNSFSYKGFDLNILVTGAFGNDIYNYLRQQNTDPNNINLGRNMLKETFDYAKITGSGADVVLSNPNTVIPRLVGSDVNGNRRFSSEFVEDGSYVRIKNIQLGYNVPKSVLAKQPVIQNARISLGVQNLATFTKYKGYDPEVGAYVGQNVGAGDQLVGVDAGRYPLTRLYTFSIQVDF
jgi:TonB-linked SusC/RagA family outer membrane protein